jgi:hypothetical protein
LPLALSDDELAAVMTAAQPLPRQHRAAFLRELASSLQNTVERGPGALYRAIATLQRRYFDPPAL